MATKTKGVRAAAGMLRQVSLQGLRVRTLCLPEARQCKPMPQASPKKIHPTPEPRDNGGRLPISRPPVQYHLWFALMLVRSNHARTLWTSCHREMNRHQQGEILILDPGTRGPEHGGRERGEAVAYFPREIRSAQNSPKQERRGQEV